MAVLKPRTAIVIVLTILAAAVFSLILLPRWQSTRANSPQQSDQSNVNPRPLTEVDKLDADKEAMWNPQGQPEATKTVLSSPINPQKPVAERIGLPHSESFDSQKPEPVKPGEAARDDGQRLLRKLKETSMESQPQRPGAELNSEKTPNTLKYERLRSLLGRMHEPHKKLDDLNRNDKPKLSKVLEKEALEKLLKKQDDEERERFEINKGKGRGIPLVLDPDNEREKERQQTFGMNKGQERQRQQTFKGEAGMNLNRNMGPSWPLTSDNGVNTAMGSPSLYRHKEPTKATSPVLTTTIAATTSPPLTTVSSTTPPPPPPPPPTPNPVKDLPSMKRGSVEIRPERLPPPADSSDIYYSLLTAPVYHNLRFSLQYLTWLQTVDPKQVSIVTDKDDNEWIQAFKKEGGNIHLPKCPLSTRKTREMMCCKTGAQFDYWYKAREAGMNYKWYCHFDDDLYVNPQALVNLLSKYDPATDQYLGAWTVVGRVHRQIRIPGNMLAPKLHTYAERKRDDFRYANGPSYCISEALMMRVEKYLRGKNFEDNCRKSDAVMDDVLPGVIIDGVLGVDLQDIPGFKSQLDFTIQANSQDMKKQAQDIISIGFGRFTISDARFNSGIDTKGVLSYHCLLHPEVSWCQR